MVSTKNINGSTSSIGVCSSSSSLNSSSESSSESSRWKPLTWIMESINSMHRRQLNNKEYSKNNNFHIFSIKPFRFLPKILLREWYSTQIQTNLLINCNCPRYISQVTKCVVQISYSQNKRGQFIQKGDFHQWKWSMILIFLIGSYYTVFLENVNLKEKGDYDSKIYYKYNPYVKIMVQTSAKLSGLKLLAPSPSSSSRPISLSDSASSSSSSSASKPSKSSAAASFCLLDSAY